MSKDLLIRMTKHAMAHADASTLETAKHVFQVPAANYTDPERFEQEVARIFKRLPLMLGMSCELPGAGDYKSMNVVGVPVLITRTCEGTARAFVNMCSHRGSVIVPEGKGKTNRFVCPYHAWTFNQQGNLIGISDRENFGEIDTSCYGLTELPLAERAGLIWVCLDAESPVDFDQFLCGYDQFLNYFGFKDWIVFDQRTLRGPNWKIAYDGYLDFYHLPVLHKETFGPAFSNQALYYGWGPHQRVMAPDRPMANLKAGSKVEHLSDSALMSGVWTIFPHISIASFDGGGRGVMISQLLPGRTVDESFTTQIYAMEKPPEGDLRDAAVEQFAFLKYVVEEEDYATGLRQQEALKTGYRDHVLFGRNEGGGQNFHRWLERVMATDTADLNTLFAAADQMPMVPSVAAE